MLDLSSEEAVYQRIDQLREERGWTIYELAKRAGTQSNTIYHWRDRKSAPSLAMLQAICDAFGITPVEFLQGKGTQRSQEETFAELLGWLNEEQRAALKALLQTFFD